jgi:hypothetical protein
MAERRSAREAWGIDLASEKRSKACLRKMMIARQGRGETKPANGEAVFSPHFSPCRGFSTLSQRQFRVRVVGQFAPRFQHNHDLL